MGQPTHGQSASIEGAATADVVMGSNVTSGSMLIMAHADNLQGAIQTPIKQAGTATIGAVTTAGAGAQVGASRVQAYQCQVTGSGSLTIRFAVTGGAGPSVTGAIHEVLPAGADTLSVDGTLQSTASGNVGSNTFINSPTLTSVPANDYVFAACTQDGVTAPTQSVTAANSTPNTGWTLGTKQDSIAGSPIATGYNQGGLASNYICQFAEPLITANSSYVACTIAIKGTGSGAVSIPNKIYEFLQALRRASDW